MSIETSVSQLRFIGPVYAKRLANLEIFTIKDLLYHFPFRYEDLSIITKISEAKLDEIVTIQAAIWQIKNIRTRNARFLTQAIINDGTSSLDVVWFNQPFLTKTLKTGQTVNFSGKISQFSGRPSLGNPEYEIIKGSSTLHTARLVPIYPETYGVSSKWLRSRISPLLAEFGQQVPEIIPKSILEAEKLLPVSESLRKIHFPKDSTEIESSRHRFSFEELFLVRLRSEIKKRDWKKTKSPAVFKIDQEKIDWFITSLPFKLTKAQERVISEILADLQGKAPMNRLLEGDVGSGKTVVGAAAIYAGYLNGYKSALMAPTEILATQHYQTLAKLLTPLGLKVLLQTGSKKMVKKDTQFDLIIGTHALLSDKLGLKELGLIIIDEQHRFGVEQRAILRSRGKPAHFLTMTATPIPRTMALTLFGDLDLSVLDEMPIDRKIIKTYLVNPEKREASYQFVREHLHQGEGAFIIAPFIEPSENLTTVKAVTTEYARLSREVFPDLSVGLLHGKLKSKEKDLVLDKFRAGEYQLLVATPVVEVGIDIPQATIMIIEGAERFGLAQIHQLRGRVGRSDLQSFCLLFTDNPNPHVLKRLKLMEKTHVGMEVAELDLQTRGPGDMYGLAQSGLPTLKVASLNDVLTIEATHLAVNKLLDTDPKLEEQPQLKSELEVLNKKITPD